MPGRIRAALRLHRWARVHGIRVESLALCTTIHSFLRAPRRISESRLWVLVGQVVNLRRIGNPPAVLGRAATTFGGTPAPFAACRYVGQAGSLMPHTF